MTTVKVSRKNQIAVPASVRKRLGIEPGDRLSVEVEGSKVILEAQTRSVLQGLIELAPDIWKGVDPDKYVRELRDEWSHREL